MEINLTFEFNRFKIDTQVENKNSNELLFLFYYLQE